MIEGALMASNFQTALITGASSGIGAELARQLAARGVAVGITARRREHLEDVAGSIRSRGGRAAIAVADAADPAATREAIEQLTAELGPPDLLIVNAGIAERTPAVGFRAETVERMMRVNVLGAAYAIEAVLPSMLARGRGQIVGISSLASYRGLPGPSAYCATKAALSTFLEGLRIDLRLHGIVVTTVHPGYVRTAMTANATRRLPWLIDVEPAARIILRGIDARRSVVNLPWPTAAIMAVVRHLPNAVFDRLARRFSPHREPAPSQ